MTAKITTKKPNPNRPPINPEVLQFDLNVSRRLLRFLKQHRWQMALGLVLMFTSVFDAVFGPAIIGRAVDDGLARNNYALMMGLVAVYLGITAISQTSSKFQISTMVRLGQTIIRDIRQILYEHVQQLSMSFFARYEGGRLISRIMGDVPLIRQFLTFPIIAIPRHMLTLAR